MNSKFKQLKPLSYMVLFLSILFLVSCGGGSVSTKPTITSFVVNKDNIKAGEVVTIDWNTRNINRAGITCDLWKDYKGEGNRKRISTKCNGTYSDRPVHEVYYTLSVNNVVAGDNSEIQTVTQDNVVNVTGCQGGKSVCIFATNLPDKKEYAFGEIIYFDLDYRNDLGESILIWSRPTNPKSGYFKVSDRYSADYGLIENRYVGINFTSDKDNLDSLRITAEKVNNTDIEIYEYYQKVDYKFKSCEAIPSALCIKKSIVPRTPNTFDFDEQLEIKVDYQNPNGKEIFFGLSASGENLSEIVYPELEKHKQIEQKGSVSLPLSIKPSSEPATIKTIWITIFERDGNGNFRSLSTKYHSVNYVFNSSAQ